MFPKVRTSIFSLYCYFLKLSVVTASDADSTEVTHDYEASDDNLAVHLLTIMDSMYPAFGPESERLLLLGETGSGKSFTSCLLANDESLQAIANKWKIKITDKRGLVSRGPVTESTTILPKRLVDEKEHAYFDCPGFDDTRSVAHEVSASYFIKILLNHTRKLKLAFVIDYNSIVGFGHRDTLLNLAIHTTRMFTNLDQYTQSVMLIVNKTPNKKFNGSLVSDQQFIESTVDELKKIKETKILQNEAIQIQQVKESNLKLIKFIDLVLKNRKIGIVRLVEEAGFINKMQPFIESRNRLKQIINELHFFDFDVEKIEHTISDKAKKELRILYKDIKRHTQEALDDIAQQIEGETIARLEEQTSDINRLFTAFRVCYNASKEVNNINFQIARMIPSRFIKKLLSALAECGIIKVPKIMSHPVMSDKVFDVLREVMVDADFGEFFRDAIVLWNDRMEVLRMASAWYEFLNLLDDALMHRSDEIDVDKLIDECNKIKKGQILTVHQFLLHMQGFLDSIGEGGLYAAISESKVTYHQVQRLKRVLQAYRTQDLIITCNGSEAMRAHGSKVLLSAVVNHLCWSATRNIDIYANSLFIVDTSMVKSTEGSSLSIFAPHWIVKFEHEFYLNGTNGKTPPKAVAGESAIRGESGRAGCHLTIIIETIENAERLNIDVTGGIGGNGQAGADGGNGIVGEDPYFSPREALEERWKNGRFTCLLENTDTIPYGKTTIKSYLFGVNGHSGTEGERGKDGGDAGLHYNDINATIIVISKQSSARFNIIHREKVSMGGAGGFGGKGGRDGKSVKVNISRLYYEEKLIDQTNEIVHETERDPYPDGFEGKPGKDNNGDDIVPDRRITFPDRSFNEFKIFLRGNLKNHPRQQKLANFLESIYDNSQINEFIDLRHLVDDFASMDEEISVQGNESYIYSILQSFIDYLEMYRTNHVLMPDERKLFRMLHAAVLAKINAFKAIVPSTLDLYTVLSTVSSRLKDTNLTLQSEHVKQGKDVLWDILKKKLLLVDNIFSKRILSDNETIFFDIEIEMLNSANLLVELERKGDQRVEEAKEQENKMVDNILRQQMMLLWKIFIEIVRLFQYSCTAILDVWDGSQISLLTEDEVIDSTYQGIIEKYFEQYALLINKIEYTEEALTQFVDVPPVKVIIQKFSTLKSKIEGTFRPTIIPPSSQLRQFEQDCISIITEAATNEEAKKPQIDRKLLLILKKQAKIFELGVILPTKFKEISGNEATLNKIHEVVSKSQDHLNELRDKEDFFIDKLMLRKNEMKKLVETIKAKLLERKTPIVIDMRKWPVKSTFRDFRIIFQDISYGTTNQGLRKLFESVNEIMYIISDFFDRRFDNYRDRDRLTSSLIALVSDKKYDEIEKTTGLQIYFNQTKNILLKNLIVVRYEMGLNAVKQQKFPFAPYISLTFTLDNETELKIFKANAILNIIRISNTMHSDDSTFCDDAKYLIQDAKDDPPSQFFLWNHTSFNTAEIISNLFRGNQISLNADINEHSSKNSVKFKEIGFSFRIPQNPNRQKDLESTLENFHISMEMGVNSFYRCNDDIYAIPNRHNTVISYKMKKQPNRQPEDCNKDYESILNGPRFFLSPYTTWLVTLIIDSKLPSDVADGIWEKLRSFEKEVIDIELLGRRQYFERKSIISEKYCTRELKNYYQHADDL